MTYKAKAAVSSDILQNTPRKASTM